MRVTDCPEESVESNREVILTSGSLLEELDDETVDIDDELSDDDVENGIVELREDLELEEPEVALDDEMLDDKADVVIGLGDGPKYPSREFGTEMSPVLIASKTSQGSCLLSSVRTLETELLDGSDITTTCSGRLSIGSDCGLALHSGFLQIGKETLA